MDFSKLLLQSLFDILPDWSRQQTENCYQPCIKYKTPPCPSQPKFLPQQFPPYYDDTDPNSITKYRNFPTHCLSTIESFEFPNKSENTVILVVIAILVLVCIVLK